MLYIVGLGNPGIQYQNTRHNIGFAVLDMIAAKYSASTTAYNKYWDAEVFTVVLQGMLVTCVYPQTYMNKVGDTMQKIIKDDPEAQFIIVYDDIALPVGMIRIVTSKSGHGGHNGVKATLPYINQTLARVKVGVLSSNPLTKKSHVVTGDKKAQYVLEKFPLWDRTQLSSVNKEAVTALECIIKNSDNLSVCMNIYNKKA